LRRTSRTSLDLIESRGDVSGGVGLCADRVEVGGGGVLAVGERDVLEASALDDGERNGGHFDCSWYSVV